LKKIIVVLILLVGLGAGLSYLGIKPAYFTHGPRMLTPMAAKLACSGYYVIGMDKASSEQDLHTYSPLMRMVSLHFNESQRLVEASLFGAFSASATYRDGLGCVINRGDSSEIELARAPTLESSEQLWPAGSQVGAAKPRLQQALQQVLRTDNAAGLDTRALLLVKDGELVAEAYADGFDQRSKLLGWSMAKSFTAVMLGNLEYRGLLDPAAKPLFPQWAGDERATISLENMLHMTSGLDFDETYDPGHDATHMLFTEYSGSDYAMRSKLAYAPASYFNYSSGTANLLSRLTHDKLGGDLQSSLDNLYHNIFTPLGMADSVLETDPSGVFVGSSYLYASARDWGRLGQLMLAGGTLNGHRLLSEDWVRRASEPNQSNNGGAYGYQFWLNSGNEALRWPDIPKGAYAAMGNRQQIVMVVPSRNMVLVRLGWTAGRYPTNENFSQIIAVNEQIK
jgi:CubicO group peptidase (beta-lactamase class C family)